MPVRRLLSFGLVIAATTASTRLAAQDTAAIRSAERRAAAESAVEQPTAPVVVDGVTLFRVRGVSSSPPERRAAEIAKRITDVASNRAIPVDSLKVLDTPRQRSSDFAVDYELNVYTDEPTRILALYTALHRNILDVFNEYGGQIMTPAYERDPEQAKVVPRDQWFLAPAAPPTPARVIEKPVPAGRADVRLATRGDGESATTSSR